MTILEKGIVILMEKSVDLVLIVENPRMVNNFNVDISFQMLVEVQYYVTIHKICMDKEVDVICRMFKNVSR